MITEGPQTTEEVLKCYGQPLHESCPCCGADVYQLSGEMKCTNDHRINP